MDVESKRTVKLMSGGDRKGPRAQGNGPQVPMAQGTHGCSFTTCSLPVLVHGLEES